MPLAWLSSGLGCLGMMSALLSDIPKLELVSMVRMDLANLDWTSAFDSRGVAEKQAIEFDVVNAASFIFGRCSCLIDEGKTVAIRMRVLAG